MSDSNEFDGMLAALGGEPEKPKVKRVRKASAKPSPKTASTRSSAAAVVKASKTVRVKGTSDQRGPRRDPAFTQVNANIPANLKASLFFYLKAEGKTLSELIAEKLAEYVDARGGILTAPKTRSK